MINNPICVVCDDFQKAWLEVVRQLMSCCWEFRNLIVHNYDKIDAEIVVGILKKSLPDFDAFKKAVVKFLEAEG